MRVWLCFPESTLTTIRSLENDNWERLEAILTQIQKNPWFPGVDCSASGDSEFTARFSMNHVVVWRINVPEHYGDKSGLQLLNLSHADTEFDVEAEVHVLLHHEKRQQVTGEYRAEESSQC